MAAQLRPTRLDVTDRFPMLGFTIRTSNPPRVAEVVLATDLALFSAKQGRSSSNFYTSREHGLLTVANGEAVYVVPPEVLGRFVAADRLYFGLATATPPRADDWTVESMPAANSPYISLSGLSDRALRRVRLFPARRGSGRYAAGSPAPMLDWAGDRAQPGMIPAGSAAPVAAVPGNGASPAPANIPYDDGFGPLPPLAKEPAEPAPAAEPPAAAQSYARGLGDDDDKGIEGPVLDEETAAPQAMALGGGGPALKAAEYSGVTKVMPSPNYAKGRAGETIDRIVIHITGAGQTPYLGSWFTNPKSEASAHYMVDQLGNIIQFVREQDTAWHAGKRAMNRRSIGIEHVAVQTGGATYGKTTYPYTPPSDVEYRNSAALVAHLCAKYGLTPDRTTIIGHREANPGTSHSVCPDGAWDWDAYMALVAAAYAPLAVAGAARAVGGAVVDAVGGAVKTVGGAIGLARGLAVDPESMGIDEPAYCDEEEAPPVQAAALALTAKEYDRVRRVAVSPAFTPGRNGKAISRIVIHITDAGTTESTVSTFTNENAKSSSHYLVGQDGEIVQFVSEADTAWHAVGANSTSIGIEHVAVKRGGASYKRRNGTVQTFPYMPPTDIQYEESAALVAHLCDKYRLTPNRSTIIGHREADPNTPHATCPDGAWNWDHFMKLVTDRVSEPQPTGQGLAAPARAMGGDGDTVEIKYRAFIPSPAIKGPLIDNYHGDGRGFSYSGGTSRGEIVCKVDVGPSGAVSNLRTNAHWSPTYAYSSDDTPAVPGKPDWWLGLNPGAAHTGQGECDGELRASFGAPGSTRNITAGIEQASIVSLYMSGNNPLATGSPAIDADVSVFLRRSADGGIEARAVGSHDGFPAHELYVNGKRLHAYDPVAAGKGPTALLPPTDIDLDTSWTSVSTATSQGQSYSAQALSGGDWSVNWDEVDSIAQPTDMSCWATAAAMLIGWRERQSVSPQLLAETNGLAGSLTGGLLPKDKKAFADALGLEVHPNACYTPEGFRDILVANGPIWVTAKVPGVHAIVVTGMYCQNGNYFVRVTDPWDRVIGLPGAPGPRPTTHNTGSQYIMTYDAFTSEFEAAGDIDRIQLLHTGGTHNHILNRGSAKAAGYAQGLADDGAARPEVDCNFGTGTSVTRETKEEDGRRYDLAQLSGMVKPANVLYLAEENPRPGEHVVLDDWPYIDGPGGRTQAGVAIDWQFQSGAVGNVVIAPIGGQLFDGWSAAVRADIARAAAPPERVNLTVRVTTTFSRPDQQDQVAVTEVLLGGDGRRQTRHDAGHEPAEDPGAEAVRQTVLA